MSNNSKDVELIPNSQIPSKWKLKYGGNSPPGAGATHTVHDSDQGRMM